jgi:hypothetical protein
MGLPAPVKSPQAIKGEQRKMLNWLSIVASFASGALWLYAANIKVSTNIAGTWGGKIAGLDEMRVGCGKQATWNSRAAVMTAIAAVLQAASHLI